MSVLEDYTGIGLQSPEEAYPALAPAPRATVTRGSSKRTVLEQIYLGLLAHAAGRAGPRGMLSAGAGYMGGRRQEQERVQQREGETEKFNIAMMLRQQDQQQRQQQARTAYALGIAQLEQQIRVSEAEEKRLRRAGKEAAADRALRLRLQTEELLARKKAQGQTQEFQIKQDAAARTTTMGPLGARMTGLPEGSEVPNALYESLLHREEGALRDKAAMARTRVTVAARDGGGGGDDEPITMASINTDIARVVTRIFGTYDWAAGRVIGGLDEGPEKNQAISDLRYWIRKRAAMGGPPDITAEDMAAVRGGGGGRGIDLGRGSASPGQVLGGSRIGAGTNDFDWDSLRAETGVGR